MTFRKASRKDLPAILQMIANDQLGRSRECFSEPLPDYYYAAFEKINSDEGQELIVLENEQEEIIATCQLSYIQYLTYRGGMRAQIEAVRVREDQRGKGIGETLFRWAIERVQKKGCHLLQLSTDKKRSDAFRFYERLGFSASHEGMKLHF